MQLEMYRRIAVSMVLALTAAGAGMASGQTSFRYPARQSGSPMLSREIPVATPIGGTGQLGGAVANGLPPQAASPAVGSGVAQAGHNPMQGSASSAVRYAGAAPAGTPGRVIPASYTPRHMRVAQMVSDVPLDGVQPMPSVAGPTPAAAPMVGESYLDEGYGCDDCGSACGSGWCGGCGPSCCDRGGCSPELIGDCWLLGLGGLLYRGEYFAGAQGWDSPVFLNTQESDYNGGFGFYTGANLGIPLCRLTCGLFSGQAGVRAVMSEINGSPNVTQLFATGGFYRRVDYGLQFGAVVDYLREDFLFEAELMQIRGDLSWVYAGGNALGFRFAKGIQDDQVPQVVAGAQVPQFRLQTLDNYRVYYRTCIESGGYSDVFIGWTDDSQIVGGLDLDMQLTGMVALQAGATYVLPTSNPANVLGGNADDAWNLSVGFVFRPQGACWYQNYDRPILPVADNGSMVVRRGF